MEENVLGRIIVHNSFVLSVISYLRRCRCFSESQCLQCSYFACTLFAASVRSSNLQTFSFFASFDTCSFVKLLHMFVSPEGTSLLLIPITATVIHGSPGHVIHGSPGHQVM